MRTLRARCLVLTGLFLLVSCTATASDNRSAPGLLASSAAQRYYLGDESQVNTILQSLASVGMDVKENDQEVLSELVACCVRDSADVREKESTLVADDFPYNRPRDLICRIVDYCGSRPNSHTNLALLERVAFMKYLGCWGPQRRAARALSIVKGRETDAIMMRLASVPHSDTQVLLIALQELSARSLTLDQRTINCLCRHNSALVRAAAGEMATKLGSGLSQDDAHAVELNNSILQWIEQLGDAVHNLTGRNTSMLLVKHREEGESPAPPAGLGSGREGSEMMGVGADAGDSLSLLDYGGAVHALERSECTVSAVSVAEAIADLRRRILVFDSTYPIEERQLCAQYLGARMTTVSSMRRWTGGIAEALIASQARAEGSVRVALELLEPLVDSSSEADWGYIENTREDLGHAICRQMATALYEGEYAKARSFALVLEGAAFEWTHAQLLARKVSCCLPSMMKQLAAYPARALSEWPGFAIKLTRAERIAVLSGMLVTLRDFGNGYYDAKQWMHVPGGVWLECVNPFTELKNMGLTKTELRCLAPLLLDSRPLGLVRTVWNEPELIAELDRMCDVAMALINHAAGRNICGCDRIRSWTDDASHALELVLRWCRG